MGVSPQSIIDVAQAFLTALGGGRAVGHRIVSQLDGSDTHLFRAHPRSGPGGSLRCAITVTPAGEIGAPTRITTNDRKSCGAAAYRAQRRAQRREARHEARHA